MAFSLRRDLCTFRESIEWAKFAHPPPVIPTELRKAKMVGAGICIRFMFAIANVLLS